jgi:hypothetical protein
MSWLITGTEKYETDPYRSNVSLLLHGDGTNGSTTIVDTSPSPKTVTAVGNAQISTAQSKFGGSSIAFDGTGDYLSIASSAAFGFGTSDFTLEYFLRSSLSGTYIHIDTRIAVPSETAPELYSVNANLFYYTNGVQVITGTNVLSVDTWHHIALSKSATSTRLFVDGQQVGSTYSDTKDYGSARPLTIGATFQGTAGLNGYIDALRITKGARYHSNFTPPTAPFPDI